MENRDEKLKNALKPSFNQNDKKINEIIKLSKQSFIMHEEERIIGRLEFLYQQSRFIKKRWWMMQWGFLILLWIILLFSDTTVYSQRCMGAAAPIFVLMIFPEIWKNRNNVSMEIECVSYYNLRQVYSARFLLFLMVDTLLLSSFCISAKHGLGISFYEFSINFILPMFVACGICFRTLSSQYISSEFLAMLICMMWDLIWLTFVLNEKIYNRISENVWIGLLILSGIYMMYCIIRSMVKFESFWEENRI